MGTDPGAKLNSSDDDSDPQHGPAVAGHGANTHGGSPSLDEKLALAPDDIYAQEAQTLLKDGGRTAASLPQHVNLVFSSNTEEGTSTKLGDWVMFCNIVHTKAIGVQECPWPPSREEWQQYLLTARPQLSSYPRFQRLVKLAVNIGPISIMPVLRLWTPGAYTSMTTTIA